jgi:uncharacterized protein YdaT
LFEQELDGPEVEMGGGVFALLEDGYTEKDAYAHALKEGEGWLRTAAP